MAIEWRRSLRVAVLAAIPLWLIDGLVLLARIPGAFGSAGDVALYLGFSLCLFIVFAAAIGILQALYALAAGAAGDALAALAKRPCGWCTPVACAVLASPLTVYVSRLLFTGKGIGRHPGLVRWGPWAAAAALSAALALGVRLARSLDGRFKGRSSGSAMARPALLSVVAALSGAFYLADATIYPGLYAYAHAVAAALSFVTMELAVHLTDTWRSRGGAAGRESAAPAGAAVVAALAGLCVLHPRLEAKEDLRHLVDAHAVLGSKLAGTLRLLERRDPLEDLLAGLRRGGSLALPPSTGAGEWDFVPARGPMNVLLVTIDALRADHVGAYGYARDTTPRIDRFARDSFVFENAYSISNNTDAALMPLFSAKLPHKMESSDPSSNTPLVRLRGGGYTTVAVNLGDRDSPYTSALNVYFDRPAKDDFLGGGEIRDAHRTEVALKELLGLRGGSFLLWVDYTSPHVNYSPPDGFARFGNSALDRYDGEIAYADHEFGRLLDGLRAQGLADRTVVILTADHGEEFEEHGGKYHGRTLYNELIKVPLVIRVPGEAGGRISREVSGIDIMPTVMNLAGVSPDREMDGVSLVPLIFGTGAYRRDAAYAEHVVDGWNPSKRALVGGGWKLIRNIGENTYELYDLRADPGERNNLVMRDPVTAARMKRGLMGYELASAMAVPGGGGLSGNALNALAGILRDETNEPARRVAIRLLGRSADRTAGMALLGLLNRPGSPEAKTEAIRCLSAMRGNGPDLPGELIGRALRRRILGDGDDGVRAEALRALGGTGVGLSAGEIESLLKADSPVTRAAAADYASSGEAGREAERILREMLLSDDSDRVRMAAAAALGALRSREAVPALLGIAEGGGNAVLRQRAIAALGAAGDPGPVPALLDIARECRDYNLRIEAVKAAGRLSGRTCLPSLMEMQRRDPSLLFKAAISDVLVAVAAPGDGCYLVEARTDGCLPEQVVSVVGAMGRVGGEEAFLFLAREAHGQTDDARRRAYLTALGESAGKVDWSELRLRLSRRTREELVSRLDRAILMKDDNLTGVARAVKAEFLSEVGASDAPPARIAELLERFLEARPGWTKVELAHRFAEATDGEDRAARRKAAHALAGSFGKGRDFRHNAACLLAVGNLRDPDSAPFLESVAGGAAGQRLAGDAAVAMAKVEREAAVGTLTALYERATDAIFREACLEALGYTDSTAAAAYLTRVLEHAPPWGGRLACCRALGRLMGEEEAGLLMERCARCEFEEPIVDLIEGLAGKGGERTIRALEAYGLGHGNARIRHASAGTIRRIRERGGARSPSEPR